MAIALAWNGAGASGQPSCAPPFTTTPTPGDLLVCFVTMGSLDNAAPEMPDPWEMVAYAVGGAGAYGVDVGPRVSAIFLKIADGSETGGSTVTVTNPGSGPTNQLISYAHIVRLTKTFSDWFWTTTTDSVNVDGAHYTATGAENLGLSQLESLDWLFCCSATRPNTSLESNPVLTVPGCTMQATVQLRSTATLQGNNARHTLYRATVQNGEQSAPATWELDWNTANVSGATTFLRVREIDIPTGIVLPPIGTSSAQGLAPSLFIGIEATGDPGIAEAIADGFAPTTIPPAHEPPIPTVPTTAPIVGNYLGCPIEDYHVQVTERCRGTNTPGSGVPVADIPDFSGLDWQRVLNNVADAHVTVPFGCLDFADDISTWRHELTIYRSGDVMWQGPITYLDTSPAGLTITGWDMWGWLGRRVVHNRLCYLRGCEVGDSSGNTEPTQIAYDLAVDGYRGPPEFEDDPCGIEWTEVVEQSDYVIGRRYRPNRQYTLSAIKKLAEQHIDFTSVGRRTLIMPKDHELGRTALLTDDHFSQPLNVPEDGVRAATRAYVRGDGVTNVAGGKSDYYGLLEVLMEDNAVKTKFDAWQAARGIVMGKRPPIRYIDLSGGASLSRDAPVTIDELVPGVTVPVISESGARRIGSDMRLTQVDVQVGQGGESVSITAVAPKDENADIDGLNEGQV